MSDPSIPDTAPQPRAVPVPDPAPQPAAVPVPAPEAAPVPSAARGLVTGASYSITVRLTADGDPASIGRIATAV
ncbi:MAG: hypothetical protein WKF51_14590, partial [Geodermatophilaceae bacterium]